MPDDRILSISPETVEMIANLRDQEPGEGEQALLIEVTGFRGAQFSYELSFAPVAGARPTDHLERHGELAVLVPEKDVEKLRGASLALTEQGLAMNNPNAPASPAMGAPPPGELTGPLAEQVLQVLEQQVNPAIAMHGGGAELVSVDGSVAYLRLFGGCQGCGMAQVTLRQGIERILLDSIPELTGVVDVTDHSSGSNPYYQSAKK